MLTIVLTTLNNGCGSVERGYSPFRTCGKDRTMIAWKQIDSVLLIKRCRAWRRSKGYTLKDIAIDTGYTISNISSFELGKNDNMYILLWYLGHGMTYEQLAGKERKSCGTNI